MNLGSGTVRLNRAGTCFLIGLCVLLVLYVTANRNVEPVTHSDSINLRTLLLSAVQAAQNGGNEIVNLKGPLDVQSKGKTKEGVDDSVTKADFLSHCAMMKTLQTGFPNIRIVSEENHECSNVKLLNANLDLPEMTGLVDEVVPVEDITVWIDPLDATKEYTEKLYQYVTTMVCVAIKQKPVIGVIYKPFLKHISWAWVKHARSPDLKVTTNPGTSVQRFIISLSHTGDVDDVLKSTFGSSYSLIYAAGAGYKVLEVAAGNATAYLHSTAIKKWDICAGNAILNDLGGRMTTFANNEIDYSNINDVVNRDKLIATVHNHNWYIDKFLKHR